MEKIKLIQTGGPYGDETCSYKFDLMSDNITLQEFINFLLTHKSDEWGYLCDEQGERFLEYRWGRLLSCSIKDTSIKIERIGSARGGWSSMDYRIKFIKEEK